MVALLIAFILDNKNILMEMLPGVCLKDDMSKASNDEETEFQGLST